MQEQSTPSSPWDNPGVRQWMRHMERLAERVHALEADREAMERRLIELEARIQRLSAGARTKQRAVYVNRSIPPQVRAYVINRDADMCRYCTRRVDASSRTLDHIVPVSAGGEHTADNLVVACRACNSKKHSKPLEDCDLALRPVPSIWYRRRT